MLTSSKAATITRSLINNLGFEQMLSNTVSFKLNKMFLNNFFTKKLDRTHLS